MPTFQHEKYIQTAFEGILQQTYDEIEVIIVSVKGDSKTNILINDLHLPPNWKHIQSSIAYAIHQLNLGFEKATSDYVIFASTDDKFLPEKIKTDIEVAEHTKANVVYGPYAYGDKDLNIVGRYDPPNPITYDLMLQRDLIPDCSLIRRSMFAKFGLWDEALGESGGPIWDFWLKILETYPTSFAYNPYVGWIYRQGEQQTTNRRPPVDVAIRKWMIERSLRRSGKI